MYVDYVDCIAAGGSGHEPALNDPASLSVVPLPPALNTIYSGGEDASYLVVPEQVR